MALISCPDCSGEVSDRAPACPKCGAPIAARDAGGAAVTTTQATSQSLKLQMVLGAVTFFIGVVVWLVGPLTLAVVLIVIGAAWYASARSNIWWHHK
jgi:hypothetical protein